MVLQQFCSILFLSVSSAEELININFNLFIPMLQKNPEYICTQILASKEKRMPISYPGFLLEDFFLCCCKASSSLEGF